MVAVALKLLPIDGPPVLNSFELGVLEFTFSHSTLPSGLQKHRQCDMF